MATTMSISTRVNLPVLLSLRVFFWSFMGFVGFFYFI